MKIITIPPNSIGGGAVYPYSDYLYSQGARHSVYGDPYNMFTIIGHGKEKRILVPRNMAPLGGTDLRSKGISYKFNSSFIARDDEQLRVLAESEALIKQEKSFIIQCSTGFGKTYCGVELIARHNKKALVVVTKEDLFDQWVKAITAITGLTLGKGIGQIQGNICDVAGHGIVLAMVQSMAKDARYPASVFKDFNVVMWDETHLVGADFFSQSCFRVPAIIRIGLSATPNRKDGRVEVIRGHIGEVLVKSKKLPMIPLIIARNSTWEVPLVRRRNPKTGKVSLLPMAHTAGKCGHITKMLSRHVGRNQALVKFILTAYNKSRSIMVLSERKDHLTTLHMMCVRAGINDMHTIFYVGGITKDERERAATTQIVFATYAYAAYGTDLPAVDVLVMATPRSEVEQIVGRAVRSEEGKKQPVVFDMIDRTSPVYNSYWKNRQKWYSSIGAPVDM